MQNTNVAAFTSAVVQLLKMHLLFCDVFIIVYSVSTGSTGVSSSRKTALLSLFASMLPFL